MNSGEITLLLMLILVKLMRREVVEDQTIKFHQIKQKKARTSLVY